MLFKVGQLKSHTAHEAEIIHAQRFVNPQNGLINLTGNEPWNKKQQGFIWARFTSNDTTPASGSEYPFELNDGASNPSIGLRLWQDDNDLGFRIRSNTGAGATVGDFAHFVDGGALKTLGLTWDLNTNTYLMISNGQVREGAIDVADWTSTLEGFTRLYVGSRNGGQDPFNGVVHEAEVGSSFLNAQQLATRMGSHSALTLITGGQSLMYHLYDSIEAGRPVGFREFSRVASPLLNREIITINGATSGSALLKEHTTDPEKWWYDRETGEYGGAFYAWIDAYNRLRIKPSIMPWSQGQADSHYLAPYKAGRVVDLEIIQDLYLKVFEELRRQANSDLQVLIHLISRRETGFTNTGGLQDLRQAQLNLAQDHDWIHISACEYDQPLHDGIHLNDAGYTIIAARTARKIAQLEGAAVSGSVDGMKCDNAVLNGTQVTVNLNHDGGTDITPNTGILGFRCFDGDFVNGTEIPITSAVRSTADQVTLTLASAPTGAAVLYYGFDAMSDINNANLDKVLRDNSPQALPIIPFRIEL
ncbi:MAG: hypothetical protein CBB87_07975 [Micavibrio sp. TMED27]|nr:hypothetical protein [Micavibrio sp.]OUT90608.1 MAG: hypothetical protein CBB87_07975 [Micavibrio sp. TMED27]|tara:strand:- start:1985 stop:3577 length:1593 start_codon:yes stop_codon:yes gene_type:complete